MLTLRFESESRGTAPNIVWMVETPSYRVYERAGRKDIAIPNEHDVEIHHPVGPSEDEYDRCFVMNSQGRTVARFDAEISAVLPSKQDTVKE